ncbi:hybrid sensor histidine kinase/response regulator [Peristeroidobacter soli]|uniref:hybrid sensor histidine kinase/response regulator n=1 Tax=Peristeroidobacter soli TaxID=2497877 RepID=UPI001588AC8C|nr:ATP-binding protein [Peristeroidobacter soli]
MLDTISDAAHRGMEMVRQIMAFGRPSAELTRGQLRPVIESSLKLMRSTLPAKIELRTDLAQAVPDVEMNAGQVSQIVMNLCINSSHAIGAAAGTIGLAIEAVELDPARARAIASGMRPGAYVCLSISDTGCGMSEATLRRIFEPYFTTKQPGKGTGLGLSLVRDIVTVHGGGITVRSRLGEGTTFDIYLPCARSATDMKTEQRPVGPHGGPIRIMHVDDDEAMAELIKELLDRMGHSVETFICPEEALAAFSARPGAYDLIVTDMNMPAMGGIDLAHKLRAFRRDLPVVLLSGWVGPEEQAMAQTAGVNGIVLKSGDVHELTETLHRMCLSLAPEHVRKLHS